MIILTLRKTQAKPQAYIKFVVSKKGQRWCLYFWQSHFTC